jgi:hypothetical protein
MSKLYTFIRDSGAEIEVNERSVAYAEAQGWKRKAAKKPKKEPK